MRSQFFATLSNPLPKSEEILRDYMYGMEVADDPDIENTQDEWFEYMDRVLTDLGAKFDAFAYVRLNMKGSIAAIKEEKNRLDAKIKSLENQIKRIEDRMQYIMETTGERKIKTDLHSYSIQKNTPTVVLDCDVLDLPQELIKYAEPVADKKAIKAILDAGTEFPFAHLSQSESLRIR